MIKENNFLKYQQYNEESSSEKIPSENNDHVGKMLKINNFTGTATNRVEKTLFPKEYINLLSDNIVIESNSQTFKGNNINNNTINTTKLEITNKSIFFTPSTICNYYQHSENEGSPRDRNNYIFINNNFQDLLMNEGSITKKHENEHSSSKSHIKYTKTQLQSGEKNYHVTTFNNSNNNTIQKANNINYSNQNYVGNMQQLVKEIKKELVLNISTLEDDYTFEEEKVKNENNVQNSKIFENNFISNFACTNEIYIEIKPLQTVKNTKKEIIFSKIQDFSIQKQQNINFSIFSTAVRKNKSVHTSISKNKNLLIKNKSKPENTIVNSYKKLKNTSVLQIKKKESANLNYISKFYSEIPKSIQNFKKKSRNELPIISVKNEISMEKNKIMSNPNCMSKINKNETKELELCIPFNESTMQATIKCKNDQSKNILNAVNLKKKEYFDLIKIMFGGKTQRNKIQTTEDKSNSLNRKTVEVSIDLDQHSRNNSLSKQSKKPLKISTSLIKNSLRNDILKCANSTRNNSNIKISDNENTLNHHNSIKNTNLIPLTVKGKHSLKVFPEKKNFIKNLPPTNSNAVFIKKLRLCEQYDKKITDNITKIDDKIKIVEDYTIISNFSKYKKVILNSENKENCNILANQGKKASNNSSKILILSGDEDNPLLTE